MARECHYQVQVRTSKVSGFLSLFKLVK
ncbi:hypothetical protein CCACVL1_05939 [Corchorus capsularis]|uniref:Uncharacterized protein n=1 Tax=Corchorus capsularis TaxID=210143 RepID=A0A1R3JI65_COCAP|nr:hypothetical protein CCACVL1_05939 [Corchorus capsularis]